MTDADVPAPQGASKDFVIPVIDLAPYLRPDAAAGDRTEVVAAVDAAARSVGFMQVVGHGVPATVLEPFLAAMDAFFALDQDVKARYRRPPDVNRGYSPPKSESLSNSIGVVTAADLFEAYNVGTEASDFPDLHLSESDYAPNVFPSEVPDFVHAVRGWCNAAGAVARTMVDIFSQALGLGSGGFVPFTDHSVDVLRMNNYRPPANASDVEAEPLGMGAHTDFGIVTVLWADPVPGLEVLDGDGRWHSVLPAPGALLVNLGDALARWTNDQWRSTLHRVSAPRVDGAYVGRRSAAFFHDGNIDARIECLPSCRDESGRARYAPVRVGEHLRQKLAGSRGGNPNPHAEAEAARLVGR